MGVYIDNLKIPVSCYVCMFHRDHDARMFCMASGGDRVALNRGERKPNWCPLHEVKTVEDLFVKEQEHE